MSPATYSKRQPAGRLRFAEVDFDPRSGEIWLAGRRQQLAPQPAALLGLLARRAGEVVSRPEAYRAIWPDDAFVDREHGLNHCVRQLRRILGDDARAPRFIETLPRRGYRFVVTVTAVPTASEPAWRASTSGPRHATGALVAVVVAAAAIVAAGLAVATGVVDRARPAVQPGVGPAPAPQSTGLGPVGESVTRHPVARDQYLRGRFLAARRTPAALGQALDHFRRALDADPDFAAARAALAGAYAEGAHLGVLPAADGFEHALSAASSALASDDALAEAFWARGVATLYRDLRWPAATEDFRRAVALDPHDARARLWWARAQAAARAHDEAIQSAETARALDPASETIVADLGWFYVLGRRFDEAARTCERALELTPHSAAAAGCLLAARFALGDEAATIDAGRRWLGALGAGAEVQADAARAYREQGRDAFWTLAAGWLESVCAVGSLSIQTAAVHLHLGDTETALGQLESAVAARLPRAPFLAVDPTFAALRGHPRFERLIAELDA